MRKYFSIILGSLLLSMVACTSNVGEIDPVSNDTDYVVLSAKALGVTRSADTDEESTLAHIDVYVMDTNFNVYHSERITPTKPVIGQGQFVMKGKKRQEFAEQAGYYVYMIANSTTDEHPSASTWDDILEFTQTDENIHITGTDLADAPKYFLMDGFAYLSTDAAGKSAKTMSPIVINDGNPKNKIELSGTLYRAAAKFVLNITQGESVEFQSSLDNAVPALSFYQLPISTLVVTPEADVRFTSTKQNTKEQYVNGKTVIWTTDDNGTPKITIIGYAYANDWSKEQSINETALLLSIPMYWDKNGLEGDGKEAASPVNWYKIPLSKQSKFERNTCYLINVNINAIGAEEQNVPVELKDIEYTTLPWQDVKLTIGDYNARYLTLNTDLVKIYDKNFDLDQLTFASSSPIVSIKLKDVFSHNERKGNVYSAFTALEVTKESEDGSTEVEYEKGDGVYAYYIDKFGQKIQLGTDPNFALKDVDHPDWTKEDILAREKNLYNKDGVAPADQYIRAEVPAEQKRALNGNIHIYSPIYADATNDDLNWNSHFNTMRYLEFEVMNEQGMTASFRVEQTPLTVISNKEGFFSYRDDYRIGDAPVYHDPKAFTTSVDKVAPKDNGYPLHYLNPGEPFFMTAGFLPYHLHECDSEGVIKSTSCGSYVGYEELLYGGIERVYHRTYSFGGPIEATFHRAHYTTKSGAHLGSSDSSNGSKYYQALGPVYTIESTNAAGETVVKYYRRHYTGNFFETFWSKYVHKVYTENGANPEGHARVKGEADIVRQNGKVSRDGWEIFSGYGFSFPKNYRNHRMYRVDVTATSSEYTIALPQMMDEDGKPTTDRKRGYTMEGEINSNIVSPSFMVASQLGESTLPTNEHHYVVPGLEGIYYYAKRQCQEYVETRYEDVDGNGEYSPGDKVYHYDDWRLPTKAEVEYIVSHQTSSRAMDKVMYAQYYYVASTSKEVYNESTLLSSMIDNYDKTGYYMRCVRDASREPEPVVYDANYNIVSGK